MKFQTDSKQTVDLRACLTVVPAKEHGRRRPVVAVGRSACAAEGAVAALNGKPESHIGAGILGKRAGERRRVAPPLQRGEQRALPLPPLWPRMPPPRRRRVQSRAKLRAPWCRMRRTAAAKAAIRRASRGALARQPRRARRGVAHDKAAGRARHPDILRKLRTRRES